MEMDRFRRGVCVVHVDREVVMARPRKSSATKARVKFDQAVEEMRRLWREPMGVPHVEPRVGSSLGTARVHTVPVNGRVPARSRGFET